MILFIPSTTPSIKLMSQLAGWLSSRGHNSALVMNGQQRAALESMGVADHGVIDFKTLERIQEPSTTTKVGSGDSPSLSSRRRSVGLLERMHQMPQTLAILALALYWALQILRFRWLWRSKVRDIGCTVAFVWGDNAGTTNGELLDLLKAHGAKLVHLPIALSDQQIIAQLRIKSAVMHRDSTAMSRWLARRFPDQILDYNGHQLFYFHPAEILAMSALGFLPGKPWVIGQSRADRVCFADESQRQYWISCGLDAAKAEVIGNFDMQNMLDEFEKLRVSHPRIFSTKRPLILFNMPNFVEHRIIGSWEEYWTDLGRFIEPFARAGYELVASLHPKAVRDHYEPELGKYNCTVTQGSVGAWIAASDIYVSCCSSTETIASEIGVPTLDIGPMYRFESTVLRRLHGIHMCESVADYQGLSRQLRATLPSTPRRAERATWSSEARPFERIEQLVLNGAA